MTPIVDFFIVWQVVALLVVTVLAIVSFQWTRGRLAALLLVGTVGVLLQFMTVMPLLLKGDPKPCGRRRKGRMDDGHAPGLEPALTRSRGAGSRLKLFVV